MAMSRTELQQELVSIVGDNVYFQPPETVKLKYPCVIYSLNYMSSTYADDLSYETRKSYTITYVTKDPDSIIPDKIKAMQYCSFDRFYTADNLNHFVFRIYI